MALSRQKIFDTIATHMMMQARAATVPCPATPGKADCLYHAPDGARCAIGCLIPDAIYHSSIENKNITDLFRGRLPKQGRAVRKHLADLVGGSTRTSRFFLLRFQRIHDRYSEDKWRLQLTRMAWAWGLDPSVLNRWRQPWQRPVYPQPTKAQWMARIPDPALTPVEV